MLGVWDLVHPCPKCNSRGLQVLQPFERSHWIHLFFGLRLRNFHSRAMEKQNFTHVHIHIHSSKIAPQNNVNDVNFSFSLAGVFRVIPRGGFSLTPFALQSEAHPRFALTVRNGSLVVTNFTDVQDMVRRMSHLFKLLSFFLSDKCELTAGSDEKKQRSPAGDRTWVFRLLVRFVG